MFLSLVMACSSADVSSCIVFSNAEDLYPTMQECLVYTEQARNSFLIKGHYARGGCILVPTMVEDGENV
tara:strand:+ start:1557 stop:1763 length:207 start_codon:yes stop_codon:yes gene_type:complete